MLAHSRLLYLLIRWLSIVTLFYFFPTSILDLYKNSMFGHFFYLMKEMERIRQQLATRTIKKSLHTWLCELRSYSQRTQDPLLSSPIGDLEPSLVLHLH